MTQTSRFARTSIIALSTVLAGASMSAAAIQKAAQPIEGSYIVVLRDGAVRPTNAGAGDLRPTVSELSHGMAAQHAGQVGRQFGAALKGFTFHGSAASAEELAADPQIAYVAEDGWVEVASEQTAPPSWGLDRVDQRVAPLDSRYGYYANGSGVDLYMVDTGIRSTHTDFSGRVDTVNAFTAIADGLGTEDCNGHGTHTAGIAAGLTYGVAKGVKLHPVRVLDCYGRGAVSGIIAGIDWITARYPAPTNTKLAKPATRAVANLSFATTWTQALDDAVTNSIAAGITYVVAAGNGGTDACFASPARVPTAITVGASDELDARASFSNVGNCVDLFAPGAMIFSSFNLNDTDALPMSGTSMAAPHVAGTVALLLSVNPNIWPADVATLVKAAANAGQMTNAGTLSPNLLLYAPFTGTGIDMKPVADFTVSCASGTCSFNAGPAADDRGISSFSWNYGNGKTGSGEKVSARYARTVLSVTVTLKVTDSIGQISSLQKVVTTGN